MSIANSVGVLFFFVMFVVGMMFSSQIPFLIVVGIVGLVGTSYYITRIVSAMLRDMRRRNS
ncbi:hypothetical protein AAGS61_12795 [Lysinibacillus sp. KU-BSD001]|uniref:hypothetical protein n=1 Tax=Lysinibacillus sp. KU-BSD001 TaxID=3141328 RepID=UPI0036E30AED